MTPEMIAQQLETSYARLERAVDGMSEEEARRVLEGRLAPIVWQVGHLAFVDGNYVQRGGGSVAVPSRYGDLFRPGTGGDRPYPSLAEVWGTFAGVHRALLRVAREADHGTALDHPARAYTNVGEMLIYACYHRGYHVGKTATLRALLGKPLPTIPGPAPARPS